MHRSNHDSNQVIYRARHGRSHLLVFGSYSYARFAANSVSPSFGSRNRNIKKGRVAWTHSQPTCIAMHGTISCIDPPPPLPWMHETRTTGVEFASISTATFAKETGLEKSILETRRIYIEREARRWTWKRETIPTRRFEAAARLFEC